MKLRRIAWAWLAAALSAAGPAPAQVPAERLLVAPPQARHFVIVSPAGEHGRSALWRLPDGSIAIRESLLLRGMVWEQDETIHIGANGQPDRRTVRGVTPSGDAAESFSIVDGVASWKTPIDAGRVRYDGRSQYLAAGATWASWAHLAESLHRARGRRLTLLPAGSERMTRLVDLRVGRGPTAKTVTAWLIEGVSLQPVPVLLDRDGSFFGIVGNMALLPPAYAGDHARLRKAQIDALAARNGPIARRFGQVAPTPVAFTHVKLFDSIGGRFVDDQTVVADGGRITAVGPAADTAVPRGARVVDGRGRTLVPGLWDAHMHVQSDQQGVMLLSMGVTSVRDPGAEVAPTLLRKRRIAAGELLFPDVHPSLLIDGRGPLAAQIGVAVSSAEAAVAAVEQARADGFEAVKFYGSMKPEWLAPAVARAHRLGLHVHGHVPATMRPGDAIEMGYDEITHINFVMMQAMPDAVVAASNGMARFEGPGRHAKDVDLGSEPMKSLIASMAARRISVDPTLVTFESLYVPDNGDLSPAYAPFLGTLPPMDERGFRQGGFTPPGVTRADFRASFSRMVELTRALHEAGVPIVAGTDGGGLELVRELELYVEAGLTPAQALQTATIAPARLVGADAATGSVSVGKEADLVLVDGDAEQRIGAMRITLWVMSKGRLMNADELRDVAGFAGRPR